MLLKPEEGELASFALAEAGGKRGPALLTPCKCKAYKGLALFLLNQDYHLLPAENRNSCKIKFGISAGVKNKNCVGESKITGLYQPAFILFLRKALSATSKGWDVLIRL